jgi:hypothetical protein
MSKPVPKAAPTGAAGPSPLLDASSRFLAELDNSWSLLRVYGTDHPAFRRAAEAAAKAVDRTLGLTVHPRGFTVGKAPVPNDRLGGLSKRLRAMGLVGLTADPPLTSAQITSLVLALDEADRTHLNGDAVVARLASATGGRVKAMPLRTANLRLMEGTGKAQNEESEQATLWRNLFSQACFGGVGGFALPLGGGTPATEGSSADVGDLAESFETALRTVQTTAQWDSMVDVWLRQLASIDPAALPAPRKPAGDAAAPATGMPGPIDGVANFLNALSPVLCQRLLVEAIGDGAAPERVLMSLADRLPAGIVLGALASLDRNKSDPSTAALALLRKMSANVPGASPQADAPPRSSAELAQIAQSLERLLGSRDEKAFVPEAYLARRQELSRGALSPSAKLAVHYPTEQETRRHAAQLTFQILSSPDSAQGDVLAGLAFVRNKMTDWVRGGELALAREAVELVGGLRTHPDEAVAKAASDLLLASVNAEELLQGAANLTDRAASVTAMSELLRHADGAALAMVLWSVQPGAGPAHDAVLEAFRKVLPDLTTQVLERMFKSVGDSVPPALLAAISGMAQADAMKAVAAIAPHAAGPIRRAAVHVIFRRDFRWPLPLTDRLLKDDEPEIRRLAVMKLVFDADLASVANVMSAATRPAPYDSDVALHLAELLRPHRRHPDVQKAWRQWLWCARRWKALLFVNISTGRRAA